MRPIESRDFRNDGFGWICKNCDPVGKPEPAQSGGRGRLMREGECESKRPVFSIANLAKWLDNEQTTLICPACGLSEIIRK